VIRAGRLRTSAPCRLGTLVANVTGTRLPGPDDEPDKEDPRMLNRTFTLLGLAALLIAMSGCVGVYDNSGRFLNDADVGETQADVIKRFGTPSFTTGSGAETVMTYDVRDNKYIILIGMYDGYDMVIVFKDGKVTETRKVQLGTRFALFSPWNWIVAD
jgi:hypothetical protein